MTILDEPTDNQDERSPLKKDVEINATTSSAAQATAPPPYTLIPTPSPNPIPSPQAIPQTVPQSHHHDHVVLLRRRSPIRRFFAALVVAWLVILLWSALLHSLRVRHFLSIRPRHNYEYEVATSRQWQLQKGVDDAGRVLPIQYPPIQLPQMTG